MCGSPKKQYNTAVLIIMAVLINAAVIERQRSRVPQRERTTRKNSTPITTGKVHVHYKPLWAAVGEPDNRFRK
jgi:hypothetical protein